MIDAIILWLGGIVGEHNASGVHSALTFAN